MMISRNVERPKLDQRQEIVINWLIGLLGRVFTNGLRDRGSIPKTQKMVLDISLLNTEHHKICIKGKVKQSKERSSDFPYTSV